LVGEPLLREFTLRAQLGDSPTNETS